MLIQELKKTSIEQEVSVWKRIASDLEGPTKGRSAVNLSRINMYCQENEVVVVPGKVLGMGNLDKKVTVAAYSFSNEAQEKIKQSGCKALSIKELLKSNPKGSNIRIIG
jgi:large subunit ribosomal protein L18e